MPDGGNFRDGWQRLKRTAVDRAIAETAHLDQGTTVLLREMRDGNIVLIAVRRGAADVSMKTLKRAPRPVVIVIGDDDGLNSGPDGFPAARRLLRWAEHVVIHAAAGRPEHYQAVAEMAKAAGSCALVETGTAHAEAWFNLLRSVAPRRPLPLVIWPTGGVHPVMPTRETMN